MTFIEALNTPHTGYCAIAGIVVLWFRDAYRRNRRRQQESGQRDVAEFNRVLAQHCYRSQVDYEDRHR